MAKLVIYGSAPVLKTIAALYGAQLQSQELTNEDFVKPVVEEELKDEEVEEGAPKKGKSKK